METYHIKSRKTITGASGATITYDLVEGLGKRFGVVRRVDGTPGEISSRFGLRLKEAMNLMIEWKRADRAS